MEGPHIEVGARVRIRDENCDSAFVYRCGKVVGQTGGKWKVKWSVIALTGLYDAESQVRLDGESKEETFKATALGNNLPAHRDQFWD